MSPVQARAILAVVGTGTLVTEYKRRTTGYSWWKQAIFDVTRRWLRFCDTVLHLPTIVHHDREGDFTIDYCGLYDNRELALRAIAELARDRDASVSQLGWVDLPRNGVAPEASGRHYDAGFPTTPTTAFDHANRRETCPFTHRMCTPSHVIDDQQLHELLHAANGVVAAVSPHNS